MWFGPPKSSTHFGHEWEEWKFIIGIQLVTAHPTCYWYLRPRERMDTITKFHLGKARSNARILPGILVFEE